MQLEKLENQHAEVNEASPTPTVTLASALRHGRPNEELGSIKKSSQSPHKRLGPLSATKELAQFDINNETLSNEHQNQTREIRGRPQQDYDQEDQDFVAEFDGKARRPKDLPYAGQEAENLGELVAGEAEEESQSYIERLN